jgi:flagellar basal body-associated protein FliL
MADKKDAKPAEKPAADGAAAPAKKGLPIKTIGIVAVVMIVEAVAVFGVFKAISPKTSNAHTKTEIHNDDGDSLKEIKVADEKFQNMRSGENWMWQVVVSVQVKKRHSANVEGILKARDAEIRDGLRQIVGNADQNMLKEPDSKALNRQFTAFLNKIVPVDEKTSEPLIERILIPKCIGQSAEY